MHLAIASRRPRPRGWGARLIPLLFALQHSGKDSARVGDSAARQKRSMLSHLGCNISRRTCPFPVLFLSGWLFAWNLRSDAERYLSHLYVAGSYIVLNKSTPATGGLAVMCPVGTHASCMRSPCRSRCSEPCMSLAGSRRTEAL